MTEERWSFGRERSSGEWSSRWSRHRHIGKQGRPGSRRCWTISVRGRGTAGDMRPVSCSRQDSALSWVSASWVGGPTKHVHRHRPPLYGPAVQKALITIWQASTFLGPVRLAGGMALFVENLTAHGHLHVEDEIRRLLLQMSPGAIGRLLVGERHMSRLHGLCHTRSTPLGGQDPHSDMHGSSARHPRRPGRGPGRS